MNNEIDYKKIIDGLETPVVLTDCGGTILFANSSFVQIFKKNEGAEFFENETVPLIGGKLKAKVKVIDNKKLITYENFQTTLEETYADFISTVSHELRTPLTSIRGFADTIFTSYEKLEPAQIKKFLLIIKEQSNRLIELVENLLSVSKMQTGHENFVYKSIDLKSKLEKLLFLIRSRYPDRVFVLNCEEKLLPVLADENKLEQIVINLADNAVKYSPENTEITISARTSTQHKGNFVDIEIKDKGCGISEENLSKIFEKFVRIENHLTRKAQGSGLGLFIVKNLVEKMGGQICVKSEPSKGSAFIVTLGAALYDAQSSKKIAEKN